MSQGSTTTFGLSKQNCLLDALDFFSWLLPKLGYLRDRNAAEHSVDSDI